MSLKRREIFAWLLTLISAALLGLGVRTLTMGPVWSMAFVETTATTTATEIEPLEETTYAEAETGLEANSTAMAEAENGFISDSTAMEEQDEAIMPSTVETVIRVAFDDTQAAHPVIDEEKTEARHRLGTVLTLVGAAAAAAAVFVFCRRTPFIGPDGAVVLIMAGAWYVSGRTLNDLSGLALIVLALAAVTVLRELWGWVLAKFTWGWSLEFRLMKRFPGASAALTVQTVWLLLFAAAAMYFIFLHRVYVSFAAALLCFVSGGICLGRYAADLRHFEQQLESYRDGRRIRPGTGSFARDEALLLDAQQRQREALERAVADERFKVELIANVSHDLRTPLTSILGYGELLRGETLSPSGQEQLDRLNLKAGYMKDLVDSLFELTKVSSGVLEAKTDSIDLIRLLEQTLGLMDDKLQSANLTVRRHYAADTLPVVTDGARMHRVFANLLGNAAKYALPGTRIHLEAGEDGDRLKVRIVNIASYEMDFTPEEIVQRFARGDQARSTSGSGLGLAIAQTYTESVGGEFFVTVDGDQFSAVVLLPKPESNL